MTKFSRVDTWLANIVSGVSQLADLLRAVAMFTVGGATALERQNSAAAKYLLAQVSR